LQWRFLLDELDPDLALLQEVRQPPAWVAERGGNFLLAEKTPGCGTAIYSRARSPLGTRYPGFWSHVVINLLCAFASLGLVASFVLTLPEFRETRSRRFDSDTAVERYQQARHQLTLIAALLAGFAALLAGFAALRHLSLLSRDFHEGPRTMSRDRRPGCGPCRSADGFGGPLQLERG
jgi:hypothetical protein